MRERPSGEGRQPRAWRRDRQPGPVPRVSPVIPAIPPIHSFGYPATYALVVDDLDDSGEPASVRTGAEEDDTADLDVPPLAGSNCCRHFD